MHGQQNIKIRTSITWFHIARLLQTVTPKLCDRKQRW